MDAVNRPRNSSSEELSADQVADYLKRHPEFFQNRDDLLLELELTHPNSGAAVSLLERQVSLLRERNMDMRQRLAGLLDNARNNDRLFEQTKRLVLQLLESQGLDELAETFERSLTDDFGIDFASLTYFGNPMRHRGVRSRVVPVTEARQHIEGLLKSSRAICGVLRPEEVTFLFPQHAREVGSAAVVPLQFGHPLGVLAIASRDPNYFRSSMGTIFLGYIAEALNRLLPRHLRAEY